MRTKIIETPSSRHICDSCDYDMLNPTHAKYQVQFVGGDSLNLCFKCIDALYDVLMKIKESK